MANISPRRRQEIKVERADGPAESFDDRQHRFSTRACAFGDNDEGVQSVTADEDCEARRKRRSVVRISTLDQQGEETDLEGTTIEDRWKMMWPLALQAWAFMGKPVEPRLPRHIERTIRD